MKILDLYKERNQDAAWFNAHSSLKREGGSGRMFEYTNTNFRTQDSFTSHFKKFLTVENQPRANWSRQENHGQEVDKHRVINMIQSKLFKRTTQEVYNRTSKGLLYSDFITTDFTASEKWIINYLFLLNGYYLNQKNYIVFRVKQLLDYLLSIDSITTKLLIEYARQMLDADSFETSLRSGFFFIHSLYDDPDFLTAYLRASKTDKEELALYIENNRTTHKYACCISKKYKTSGNFNLSMLTDETRVFLLTLILIEKEEMNLGDMGSTLVRYFNQNIVTLQVDLVLSYLENNKNIFYPIFAEVLELEERASSQIDTSTELASGRGTSANIDIAEEYIDETDQAGKLKIQAIYEIRKKQARIESSYKCALETVNNCGAIYFTAKANNKNYLELHHLVPREFRNDFTYSIEVLANYVTLCPRCHRQIHLAVDRERKHLLNTLYEDRRERLTTVGLGIEREILYGYYKVTE